MNIVKTVHLFTHALPNEMRRLFDNATITTGGIVQACEKFSQACDRCASCGRRIDMEEVSLSHVNQAINHEIQADLVVFFIGDKKWRC